MWLRATSSSWIWREGAIHATFEKEASVRWMVSAESLHQQRAGCAWSTGGHLYPGNTWSLECNNFRHETKETLQDGFKAAGDTNEKAFELILAQPSQEQAIRSSGFPTSFGNTKKMSIQTHECGGGGQPPALPDSSERFSWKDQEGSSKMISWWIVLSGLFDLGWPNLMTRQSALSAPLLTDCCRQPLC